MLDVKKQVPFVSGLWTVQPSGEARLVGSRCLDCSELFFPVKSSGFCPHCYGSKLEEIGLGPLGTLAAYTTVLQPPAGGFYHGPVPFHYGLVDLDEGIRVEVHLGGDPASYHIGQRMTLRIEPFYVNEQGDDVQVFRFVPIEEKTRQGSAV
jgi:uncharacterized OB-fold protein